MAGRARIVAALSCASCIPVPDLVVADASPLDAAVAESAPPTDAGGTDAGSPIAFIQAQTTNARQAPTATVTFGNPVTAHSTVILCFIYDSTTATPKANGITDSLGNAYTLVVGPARGAGMLYIAVAADVVGGRDTVSVALDAAPDVYFEVYAHEYSGLARVSPFDVGGWSGGTSTAPDAMTSGPLTTTRAGDLLLGCGQGGVSASGSGFWLRTSFDGNVTEDQILGAPGSYQATATMVSGTRWTMLGAAFKPP